MVRWQIPERRGSFVIAYLHFGRQQPGDLEQALEDFLAAVRKVRAAQGSEREAVELVKLAGHLAGLRERVDAATVDVAVRLKEQGVSVVRIAEALHTVRPTIDAWLRRLPSA